MLFRHALLGVGPPLILVGALSFLFLTYQLEIIQASFERSRDALTRDIAGTSLQ